MWKNSADSIAKLKNGNYFSGDSVYWLETKDINLASVYQESQLRSMMWDCWGFDEFEVVKK